MRVAIIGAGVMGANIARALAGPGTEVALCSRTGATLHRAECGLRADGVGGVSLGTSVADACAGADVVIESVPESLSLKRSVLGEACVAAGPTAVVATNTSSLSVDELAAGLDHPERFLGWHWFNPAHLIPLVEVIPTALTAPEAVTRSTAILEAAGKRPAQAPAIDGFLVNRLQYALIREALSLVDAGLASPTEIDAAVTGCLGPRWAVIGPMRSTDLAGIPTAVAVARALYPGLSAADEPPPALTDLERAGRLGATAGRGFYDYPAGGSDAFAWRDRRLRAVLHALQEDDRSVTAPRPRPGS